MTKTTEELLADALARIELAKHALIVQGYFKADELSDDIAPRITELASHLEQRAERLAAALELATDTLCRYAGIMGGDRCNVLNDGGKLASKTIVQLNALAAAPVLPEIFSRDFTELMDEVTRVVGHTLPDEAHGLIGDYVSACIRRAAPSAPDADRLRDALAAELMAWAANDNDIFGVIFHDQGESWWCRFCSEEDADYPSAEEIQHKPDCFHARAQAALNGKGASE